MKPFHVYGLKIKDGVYAANDPKVIAVTEKYVPMNKPWYFIEVRGGVGRIYKDVNGIRASASDALSLAEAGSRVADIDSFIDISAKTEKVDGGGGAAPSIADALREKLSTSAPKAPKSESDVDLSGDYADLGWDELRALAKSRGLSAAGGRDAVITRLAKDDLGEEE